MLEIVMHKQSQSLNEQPEPNNECVKQLNHCCLFFKRIASRVIGTALRDPAESAREAILMTRFAAPDPRNEETAGNYQQLRSDRDIQETTRSNSIDF
jgi:hypothetical protein